MMILLFTGGDASPETEVGAGVVGFWASSFFGGSAASAGLSFSYYCIYFLAFAIALAIIASFSEDEMAPLALNSAF